MHIYVVRPESIVNHILLLCYNRKLCDLASLYVVFGLCFGFFVVV